MRPIAQTVAKLCRISVENFSNPFVALDWPATHDPHTWYTSPELISISGTQAYANLDEDQQKRLSLYEAVNFYSLNIHGEKALIAGLAQRLYRQASREISPYLHHFLDEENKHMFSFGRFCQRYAGKIYGDKKMSFPAESAAGEEDFLFFAKVLIFEEIVAVYNRRMGRDTRLAPIARQINWLHHCDEARHLVFGRQHVAQLFQKCSAAWSPPQRASIQRYLSDYLEATWKEYYNPAVYRDVGMDDAFRVRQDAFAHPVCRTHRRAVSRGCVRFFQRLGLSLAHTEDKTA